MAGLVLRPLDVKVTKKLPVTIAGFEEFFRLAAERADSDRSWTVSREEIEPRGYDLRVVNPNAKSTEDTHSVEELLEIIDAKRREVSEAIEIAAGEPSGRGLNDRALRKLGAG